jgi:hypothetical protein
MSAVWRGSKMAAVGCDIISASASASTSASASPKVNECSMEKIQDGGAVGYYIICTSASASASHYCITVICIYLI